MKCSKCYNKITSNLKFCTNCGKPVSIKKSLPKKSFLKKIFVFPYNELNNKWWHRLAKIITYASTIAVFLFFIVFLYNNLNEQINPNPKYVYSFTKEFNNSFGLVEKCNFAPENSENYISIKCGYINKDIYKENYSALIVFLDKYMESSGMGINFWNQECPNSINSTKKQESYFNIFTGQDEILQVGLPKYCPQKLNYRLINQKIEQGLFNDVTVKKVILIYPLLRNIALVLFAPILWFLFIKLFVYKSLIYIIYGNK